MNKIKLNSISEQNVDKSKSNIIYSEKLKISLTRNQYIIPSAEIYGGFSGFHDYGVMGIKTKNKLIEKWRQFFLFEEEIDEIETSIIMPYVALQASGHVDRFQDFIVYDNEKKCHRADHLLENFFEKNNMPSQRNQVSSWNADKMTSEINKYNILKDASKVLTKNMMYEIVQANNSDDKTYTNFLRPELAQGIFTSFKRISDFTKKKLPFGIAQVGKSYRKEISPTPFTRMREFTQAEIEFFIDPKNPNYKKIENYLDLKLPLLSSESQESASDDIVMMSVEEAVKTKIINHETMAYFLVRIYLFAKEIDLKDGKIRFRQHMPNEMAHYANQCWDLECLVSNKWLECVGIADRGSYDLEAHSIKSGTKLICKRQLENPYAQNVAKVKLNMKLIGKKYKSNTSKIVEYFNNLNQNEIIALENNNTDIHIDDTDFIIDRNMIYIYKEQDIIQHEEFYPHTIEPSIGIDRILYAVFEQNFFVREDDDKRIVLALPKCISPYDVAVFSLYKNQDMDNVVNTIKNNLRNHKISGYIDCSNVSIGRKYSRLDEIGIKYAITVDPGSLEDKQVTVRERNSMSQIRVPIQDVHTLFL